MNRDKNLKEDPDYTQIKAEMLSELGKWRKNVIHDQGVSEDFRAINVFPASCPMSKVDDWARQTPINTTSINTDGPLGIPPERSSIGKKPELCGNLMSSAAPRRKCPGQRSAIRGRKRRTCKP